MKVYILYIIGPVCLYVNQYYSISDPGDLEIKKKGDLFIQNMHHLLLILLFFNY